MESMLATLEKIVPETIQLLQTRYRLLQCILEQGPIGRRSLSVELQLSERTVRNEVDSLLALGLVQVTRLGITITTQGEKILLALLRHVKYLGEPTELEQEIQNYFQLKQVIIVRGNADEEEQVKERLGIAGANILCSLLKNHCNVAITGGTTISKMVDVMPKRKVSYEEVTIIPARGSVGKKAELQANTIAVQLAEKLGANYELFTMPDNLSMQSICLIKDEPQMRSIRQKIENTDILLFGIGEAMKMAKRRKESQEVIDLLIEKGAVAEVFRHYFDKTGNVVYATEAIGINPAKAMQVPRKIAIAGGKSKASALMAVKQLLKDSYLIVDEAIAREIAKNYKN